MAKNDDNMLEREKGGSRVVTVLIALAIVAIWLIIFACLIKFDVGGIGSKVLYPALKDVPVVNRILPTPSEEEQARQGNYEYNTLKSANARIKELESQLASENGTTNANADYIADLEDHRLRSSRNIRIPKTPLISGYRNLTKRLFLTTRHRISLNISSIMSRFSQIMPRRYIVR